MEPYMDDAFDDQDGAIEESSEDMDVLKDFSPGKRMSVSSFGPWNRQKDMIWSWRLL